MAPADLFWYVVALGLGLAVAGVAIVFAVFVCAAMVGWVKKWSEKQPRT